MSTDPVDLYGDNDIYLYDNNDIYLYNDPTFNEDFDDRFPFVYETNKIYERIYFYQDLYNGCINEIINYNNIFSQYGNTVLNQNQNSNQKIRDLIGLKISDINSFCNKYQVQINKLNTLLDKIEIIKNLSSNKKQMLYDYYKVLGYAKIRFSSLFLDKYNELIAYSEPLLYDSNISEEKLKEILEIIFVLEEELNNNDGR
jgi:hypothetical protein